MARRKSKDDTGKSFCAWMRGHHVQDRDSKRVAEYNQTRGRYQCEQTIAKMIKADPLDPFIGMRVASHLRVGIADADDYNCEFKKTMEKSELDADIEYFREEPINQRRL